MTNEEALHIVFDAIDVVNRQRGADAQIAKRLDVVLAGDGGALDSLGLVTLILAIEHKLAQVSGIEVELIDALGDDHEVPNWTAQSFRDLILERLADV